MTEPSAPPRSVAELAERVAAVHGRIRRAGGDPDRVTLVGVTKGQPMSVVELAGPAGLTHLGHNYQQGLLEQHRELVEHGTGPAPRWHFIGGLQSNKVRKLAPVVTVWETVDRRSLGVEIARHSPGAEVLVQVNTTAEPQKGGCAPDDAPRLVDELRQLGLDVRGLMTIGPAGEPELARPAFRRLRALADRLGLAECSMGMSNDLEVAVAEGSTAVRVGTALFGARPQPPRVRD